jgi:hypothetical protein
MAKNTTPRKRTTRKPSRSKADRRVIERNALIKKLGEYTVERQELGVTDRQLESMADYLASRFEFATEPVIVLVSLLNRLLACANAQSSPSSSLVSIEDAINELTQRLFSRCIEGENAAERFAKTADARAARITGLHLVELAR